MQPQQLPGQDGSRVLGLTGESTELRLTGRGPWVCISPWNFSLVDSTALPEIKNQSVAQYQQALPAMDGVATEVTPQATAPVTALAAGQPVAYMTNRPLAQSLQAIPASVEIANLMAPQAFEVASISDLKEEIFGPVLHIVRWRGDPQAVIAQINALGYGLTLGIQTRIDSRAQALARAAHIGNVYINRNQIGAVVGVQPFGGEGQSGTGPKAGGPHYLYRFCAEQTITVNTTAAGGNVQLMA